MRSIRFRTRQRGSKKDVRRDGAAMVELAVCLPIFLAVLLGIIEFGRAMSVAQLLNAAAREGCRDAIIEGSNTAGVRAAVLDQVVKTVGCPEQNVAVDITVTRTSGQQSTQAIDVSAAESRDLITVKVSVPYSAISYSLSKFLTGKTLRGACAMRRE